MIQRLLTVLFLISSIATSAQHYKPTDKGSKIHFTIKNFGINTGGDLAGLKGSADFIPTNLKASSFHITVDVKTIDTDNGSRDEHLKSKDYFDAERYPVILLNSTAINLTSQKIPGFYFFTGTLTMHGITKVVEFPFTANIVGSDCLFKGEFELNRMDYGIGKNSSVLSKIVKVSLSVLAKRI